MPMQWQSVRVGLLEEVPISVAFLWALSLVSCLFIFVAWSQCLVRLKDDVLNLLDSCSKNFGVRGMNTPLEPCFTDHGDLESAFVVRGNRLNNRFYRSILYVYGLALGLVSFDTTGPSPSPRHLH